jgi:hypothetical protein
MTDTDIKAMTDQGLIENFLTGTGAAATAIAPDIKFLYHGLAEGEIFTADEFKLAGLLHREAEELFWMFALARRAAGGEIYEKEGAGNEI